jgi:hypothetical protein
LNATAAKVDAAATTIAAPSGEGLPSPLLREASALLWTILEHGGSPILRDAATALYSCGPAVPRPEDTLRHMLHVALAVLCDSASIAVAGEPAPLVAGSITPSQLVASAERVIEALEEASWVELADAHSYFLAPPWSWTLAIERPLLADLAFGIARFMIDCAWQWTDERLPPPRVKPERFRP